MNCEICNNKLYTTLAVIQCEKCNYFWGKETGKMYIYNLEDGDLVSDKIHICTGSFEKCIRVVKLKAFI